jgi:hypothetical protein
MVGDVMAGGVMAGGVMVGGRLQVTYSDDPLARFRLNCRETDDVGSRRATSSGHGN